MSNQPHWISTHILDTTRGIPAPQVRVRLLWESSPGSWVVVDQGLTNSDGRYVFAGPPTLGVFQIEFETEAYFWSQQQEHFFKNPVVSFQIQDLSRKYHVPLLLNPYGYSTYRGS